MSCLAITSTQKPKPLMLQRCVFQFEAMASPCTLYLYAAPQLAAQVAKQIEAEVLRIQQTYSRYLAHNPLAQINNAAKTATALNVNAETAGLLDFAQACYAKSDGLFDITSGVLRQAWSFNDPTLPSQESIDSLLPSIGMDKLHWQAPHLKFLSDNMALDLGGIGKEYAVDRAADICTEHEITHGLIDFGGDIRVLGPTPDNAPWEILIRHPRAPDTAIFQFTIFKGAVATSGDYERFIEVDGQRYCHILNPKTGWPVQGLSSVTVVAETCMLAGCLSTIAMLKESAGKTWLADMGLPHYWVDNDMKVGGSLLQHAQSAED